MDNQIETSNPQRNKWRNRLILFLRWAGGWITGLVIGLFLYFVNEAINPPLIGPILAGQEEFFEDLVFILLYDHFKSSDPIDLISLLLFSTIWGIAGALLFSGKKRQIRLGVILLILYSIIGMVWYVFKLISVISN